MRRRCLRRGCTVLITRGSYCTDHRPYRDGWHVQRAEILQRDGYQCQIRGPHCTGRATTVDHINGDALDNRAEQLQSSCRECNSSKGGLA